MSLRPAVVASSDSLRPECGLRLVIEQAWEERAVLSPQTAGSVREAVDAALDLLDSGVLRVAEPDPEAGGCMSGSRRLCCCPFA
jgi:hypothetical protein